jgi:hypothetical protein
MQFGIAFSLKGRKLRLLCADKLALTTSSQSRKDKQKKPAFLLALTKKNNETKQLST